MATVATAVACDSTPVGDSPRIAWKAPLEQMDPHTVRLATVDSTIAVAGNSSVTDGSLVIGFDADGHEIYSIELGDPMAVTVVAAGDSFAVVGRCRDAIECVHEASGERLTGSVFATVLEPNGDHRWTAQLPLDPTFPLALGAAGSGDLVVAGRSLTGAELSVVRIDSAGQIVWALDVVDTDLVGLSSLELVVQNDEITVLGAGAAAFGSVLSMSGDVLSSLAMFEADWVSATNSDPSWMVTWNGGSMSGASLARGLEAEWTITGTWPAVQPLAMPGDADFRDDGTLVFATAFTEIDSIERGSRASLEAHGDIYVASMLDDQSMWELVLYGPPFNEVRTVSANDRGALVLGVGTTRYRPEAFLIQIDAD